jgi:ribosome recycling factor
MYDQIISETRENMQKAVEHFKKEVTGLRSGRATPALVENVKVDYYGSKMPLNQVAAISVPDPRSIAIKPFDVSSIKEIEKAIQLSEVGINPQNDGKIVRLQIPMFSEDQRKKLVARVKEMAEQSRVTLRNVRRDSIKNGEAAKKDSSLTEDDLSAIKDEIQEILKENEKQVDEIFDGKSKEILEV